MAKLTVHINDDFYNKIVDLKSELQKKRRRNVGMSEVLCCSAKKFLESERDNSVRELLKVIH